jgi:hypothetical protein
MDTADSRNDSAEASSPPSDSSSTTEAHEPGYFERLKGLAYSIGHGAVQLEHSLVEKVAATVWRRPSVSEIDTQAIEAQAGTSAQTEDVSDDGNNRAEQTAPFEEARDNGTPSTNKSSESLARASSTTDAKARADEFIASIIADASRKAGVLESPKGGWQFDCCGKPTHARSQACEHSNNDKQTGAKKASSSTTCSPNTLQSRKLDTKSFSDSNNRENAGDNNLDIPQPKPLRRSPNMVTRRMVKAQPHTGCPEFLSPKTEHAVCEQWGLRPDQITADEVTL